MPYENVGLLLGRLQTSNKFPIVEVSVTAFADKSATVCPVRSSPGTENCSPRACGAVLRTAELVLAPGPSSVCADQPERLAIAPRVPVEEVERVRPIPYRLRRLGAWRRRLGALLNQRDVRQLQQEETVCIGQWRTQLALLCR